MSEKGAAVNAAQLGITLRRRRTPTVLQMEAVECGAACLGMVLAYFGRYVPLEALRVECGVSRDGSKASNLLRAARRWGLEARGGRWEIEGLDRVKLPAIVFWNFNHFVVLEGFRKGGVEINDPALGRRRVTYEEFDQAFTGVVLEFEPGAQFTPGGDQPSVVSGLLRRSGGTGSAVVMLILVGLATVVPSLLIPVFSKIFVDEILVGTLDSWLLPLLVGMVLTASALMVLTWMEQSTLLRLRTKLALTESSRFFWHVLRLPPSFYQQRDPGEISSRVALNEEVAQTLAMDLSATVVSLFKVLFFLALMIVFDPLLAAIAVLVAAGNVVLLQFVSRLRAERSQRLIMDHGKLAGTSMSGLRGIETIKAAGGESDFFAKWAGHHARAINAEQHLAQLSIPLSVVPILLNALNTALILGFGGLRVMEGALTIGGLVAFQALVAQFVGPVNGLVSIGSKIQEMSGNMRRLDDVANHPPQVEYGTETVPEQGASARLSGHLVLRDLTFGFSPVDPPLIERLSLEVRPGERVALVGASGCGKSTVVSLVAGLATPWSGEILFDGRPREDWPRDVVLNSMAMVSQEIELFSGTIRENLSMWDATIPEERVVQAAKDAAIHTVIASRPGGYEAKLNEGGRNLSGGQRQRLEIARALVSLPSILLLDEATSALDSESEQQIDGNIRRRGCSCLIVAHRLSTIRDCDQIVVLDAGRVVERGTHDELLALDGAYRALVETM